MENTRQLRPLGQLLTDTWKTYRLNFKKLTLLMLWGILGIVPSLVFTALAYYFNSSSGATAVIFGILSFLAVIFNVYWSASAWIGLLLVLKNPTLEIMSAFNQGRRLIWGNIAVGIIAGLFIVLWSFLFFIPGIIFLVFYCLSVFAFVYGGYHRGSALKRSRELVKGNWWAVFGRLLFYLLALIIVGGVFGLLARVLGSPIISSVLQIIYYLVNVFIINILFTVYLVQIYDDLDAAKPASVLPKEKDDQWLVVLASVALVILFVCFAYIAAVASMLQKI